MSWGRKKPSSSSSSSSSSSHPHLISHVFPLSWLSKFKRTSDKPSTRIQNSKQKEKQQEKLQRVSSLKHSTKIPPTFYWDNRFYTQDDDGFWRFSLNKENTQGDNKLVVPENYCGNCKSNVKQAATKKRNQKSRVLKAEIVPEKEEASKEHVKKASLRRTYRRIMEATEELHRELDEVNGYRKSVEKEMSEFELLHVMQMMGRADARLPYSDSGKNPSPTSRDFGSFHQETKDRNDTISEWQNLKDDKIKEVLLKSDQKQRKSFHVGRGTSKVKVSSPKTPSNKIEICKVKALEDMKKAKMKKKLKELQLDDKATDMGSFAVVKSSRNPQQDFRDSMFEMIMEKRIRKPEELEELLACYLTLNADEYHGLIIKAFRQVWRELEEACYN